MILVTGITGHTGKWFIERLKKEGYKETIRCIVRESSNTRLLDESGLNIHKVYGNLNDLEFLKQVMSGIDTVLHIAGIHFSLNVYDAAVHNGVRWLILVHTTGRYSKYKSAAAGYIEIEDKILKNQDKINITILRPTMIYGSSQDRNIYKLVDYLYRHKIFPVFGSGKNLMQPVHARDLGNAYYDVLTKREITINKQYNLSGGEPIAYIDLVKKVSAELGRKNLIIRLPMWFSIVAAYVYNMLDRNAIISVEQVLRMLEDKDFSFADATRDFGYNPITFGEGIKEEVREYLEKTGRYGDKS